MSPIDRCKNFLFLNSILKRHTGERRKVDVGSRNRLEEKRIERARKYLDIRLNMTRIQQIYDEFLSG